MRANHATTAEARTTARFEDSVVETAPDGSRVRPLVRTEHASMAHFELDPGQITQPVRHRRVDELWFVVAGTGSIWRQSVGVTKLTPGTAVAIEAGAAFQFRADDDGLAVVAATIPAWTDGDEAEPADGIW